MLLRTPGTAVRRGGMADQVIGCGPTPQPLDPRPDLSTAGCRCPREAATRFHQRPITDPPYATVDRRPKSGYLKDWFRGSLSWRDIGRILAVGRRKMAPDGIAFVMTNEAGLDFGPRRDAGRRLRSADPGHRLGPSIAGSRDGPPTPGRVRSRRPAARLTDADRDRSRIGRIRWPWDGRSISDPEARGPRPGAREDGRRQPERSRCRPVLWQRCPPRRRRGTWGDGHRLRYLGACGRPRDEAPACRRGGPCSFT